MKEPKTLDLIKSIFFKKRKSKYHIFKDFLETNSEIVIALWAIEYTVGIIPLLNDNA